jgi:hypothetical protein
MHGDRRDCRQTYAAGRARHSHMIVKQALDLGVEVGSERALRRRKLQSVGERGVPFDEDFFPVARARPGQGRGCKAAFQIFLQRAEQSFVLPVQAPLTAGRIEDQNADVDPLVSHPGPACSAVRNTRSFCRGRWPAARAVVFPFRRFLAYLQFGAHLQFGSGWRLLFFASSSNSGTHARRRCSCSTSRSSAS